MIKWICCSDERILLYTKLINVIHHVNKLKIKNTYNHHLIQSVQPLSHVQLGNPMDCRTLGFPVHHQLVDIVQTHVH